MRISIALAIAATLAVLGHAPAAAQSAGAQVQASVTVVDPARVRVDAAQADVDARGGLGMSATLNVAGAGSPAVLVGDGACEVVAPAAGRRDAPRLRCRAQATPAGGVAQVPVTLLIVPAT